MLGAMLAHWTEISTAEQITFSVLVVLGLYMLYRAMAAQQSLKKGEKYYSRYMDGIGFTLISLFDGFVIVGAIDLKFPVWAVVIGAILALFAGNHLIKKAKIKYLK